MQIDTNDPLAFARNALRMAQQSVLAEIGSYPGPVSGCDAQFNHLLSLRQKLGQALAALDKDVVIPTPRSPN